jgi:RHS repeat-associated protein
VPAPSQFGGPSLQSFRYDDLYRLTSASGTYQFAPDKTRRYSMGMAYDTIHNIQSKTQLDEIVQPSAVPIRQHKTSYTFGYQYNPSGAGSVRPHAPIHIGDRTFSYDANGNQTGWQHDRNGTRRSITWDEENRIQTILENGQPLTYKYNDAGERVIKRGPQGETVYVNPYFTIRNREVGTKHVFAGTSRVVSKLMKQDKPGSNQSGQTPVEKDLYFYHPDHLGSSSYVTDTQGRLYEHLEYFPYGETWVEEATNTQRTPYLFTSKELDEETGLYYFGARYYDPRTSVWQSTDPILDAYLQSGSGAGEALGGGDASNPRNLNLFAYVHLNPLRLRDPDGRRTEQEEMEYIARVQENPSIKARPVQEALQKVEPFAEALAEMNPLIATLEAVSGESATGRTLSKKEQALAAGLVAIGPLGKLAAWAKGLVGAGRIDARVTKLASRFSSSAQRQRVLESVISAEGGVRVSDTVARQFLHAGGERASIPTLGVLEG